MPLIGSAGSCRSSFLVSTHAGSEFINHHLFKYCTDRAIVFTRSRPFHKNDNCHVEQKNRTLVRRLIGYDRLDTPAQQAWLDAFYTDLLRPFANCFQPVMKLIGKEAADQRTPASTTSQQRRCAGSSTTKPSTSTSAA
ncbi:MAG: hypothetical protein ACRENL_11090 [Candidatus Dormibacteria bacterium]